MINIIDRIVVSESGCGMDSARVHGIIDCFDFNALNWRNKSSVVFVTEDGVCRRHPTMTHLGANNPNNFSRDQLMCLAAGLWGLNYGEKVLPIIEKARLRNWFAPNVERDYPGTTKWLFPHVMHGGDPVDEGKVKPLDSADPLLAPHILHLYRCARATPPPDLLTWGNIGLHTMCVTNSNRVDNEQNQLQCMVKVAGDFWIKLYKAHNPMWEEQTKYYWHTARNCPEIYNIIINNLRSSDEEDTSPAPPT